MQSTTLCHSTLIQTWGGSPAKFVSKTAETDVAGIINISVVTAELGKLHMEEAWKDPALVNQEHDDYKREVHRTPEYISSLRYDPGWVPLPTLGEHLSKIGVLQQTYTIK